MAVSLWGADGSLERIVEAKDANEAERAGAPVQFRGARGAGRDIAWSCSIGSGNDNAKGEYYLTDIVVGLARADGLRADVVRADASEVLGVNNRADLAIAEAAFQGRARAQALEKGVTLIAPETVFFSHDTELAADVTVEPNVVFGPGVCVESGAVIRAFSHLEGATVHAGAQIGPYARLTPWQRHW